MTWSPDAVIWATVRRYKDIASIWRCPHSLSPTTGRPVFEENLAWIESTGEFVSLNFSTYIILIIIKSYILIVMIKRSMCLFLFWYFSYLPCLFDASYTLKALSCILRMLLQARELLLCPHHSLQIFCMPMTKPKHTWWNIHCHVSKHHETLNLAFLKIDIIVL